MNIKRWLRTNFDRIFDYFMFKKTSAMYLKTAENPSRIYMGIVTSVYPIEKVQMSVIRILAPKLKLCKYCKTKNVKV